MTDPSPSFDEVRAGRDVLWGQLVAMKAEGVPSMMAAAAELGIGYRPLR